MKEEEAPSVINMVEKPAIKASVLKKVLKLKLECLRSSIDNPEIKDMYAGTNGKTQGERKDMKPAMNASVKVTSVIKVTTLNIK